jgi:hypothetical protein
MQSVTTVTQEPCSLLLGSRRSKKAQHQDGQPQQVLLCDTGMEICRSKGIKSCHLKRSSNGQHVAVSLTNPATGKRQSTALWRIVTMRWEKDYTVRFLNGDIFDHRLSNLETSQRQKREPAQPKPEKPKADPAKLAAQWALFEEHAEEFRGYLLRVASKVLARYSGIRNRWSIAEDIVSAVLPDVLSQLSRGNCHGESYEAIRGWAASIVAFQAGITGKCGDGGRWGDYVPDRPKLMAEHEAKQMYFDPEKTQAELRNVQMRQGKIKNYGRSKKEDGLDAWDDES